MKESESAPSVPSHILVLGAGIFGLSTTLALLRRPIFSSTKITLLDSAPVLPNPVGASVDTSRIIRPDYALSPYARLMREAQEIWRGKDSKGNAWGAEGRYVESGLALLADSRADADAEEYLKKALDNVTRLAEIDPGIGGVRGKDGIQELHSKEEIAEVFGNGAMGAGDWGYVNWGSGWADAEKSVSFVLELLKKEGVETERLEIRSSAVVKRLLYTDDGKQVVGAKLHSGEKVSANLTILATGSWTPTLLDLRGRAVATGQILTYVDITESEQEILGDLPVLLNENDGTFIIPPRDRVLKVARHGFGYKNPTKVPNPMPGEQKDEIEVSVPVVGHARTPKEGLEVCRRALKAMVTLDTGLLERPFSRTRICWYCDTFVAPVSIMRKID